MTDNKTTAAQRFALLDGRRGAVLDRAEDAAAVTIPALFVREGHSETTKLRTPYQALGARAVNTLSSKILLALFPPNARFFRMGLDAEMKQALEQQGEKVEDIEAKLADIESIIVDRIEATRLRQVGGTALKSLLVTGNYLLHIMRDGSVRGFGLRQFVVDRDPAGTVIEVVLKESVSPETLSDEVKDECGIAEPANGSEKNVDVYTRMTLEDGKYRVYQEINGETVSGSSHSYPTHAPPFIVLRWTAIAGEDYGRGMVDEYLGDFQALDNLSRDLLKASANAAKIIWLLDPNSTLRKAELTRAPSGSVLHGKATDINALTLDKFADFRITLERVQDITAELQQAFLMNRSAQRDAERVTAEEIRFIAQELEDALGGVYSVLAGEFQLPLVHRYMAILTKAGKLPAIPKDDIRLTITTGMEALGRGHELNKIVAFIRTGKELLGEQQLIMRLDAQAILKQIATSLGLETKGMVKDEQAVQAEMQQNAMQQMVQDSAPGVAAQLAKGVTPPNG